MRQNATTTLNRHPEKSAESGYVAGCSGGHRFFARLQTNTQSVILSEVKNLWVHWDATRGFFAWLRRAVAGVVVPNGKASAGWPLKMGLAMLFLCGLLNGARAADPEMRLSPRKIRDEVHATVEAQLSALREGDFERAYELASSAIKMQFDVRLFAALIRHGYPVLLQANEADIGVVRDKNEEVAQVTVSMLDRHKRNVVYSYWLVKEEGGWRINGVVLEQKPPRGDI